MAGTPMANELGKCPWNNRLEAGVQLRPGAPDPPNQAVSLARLDVVGKLGVQRWSSNEDFFFPNGSPLPSFSEHATEFA
jgi:hypothetical protein